VLACCCFRVCFRTFPMDTWPPSKATTKRRRGSRIGARAWLTRGGLYIYAWLLPAFDGLERGGRPHTHSQTTPFSDKSPKSPSTCGAPRHVYPLPDMATHHFVGYDPRWPVPLLFLFKNNGPGINSTPHATRGCVCCRSVSEFDTPGLVTSVTLPDHQV
jgi:hypothetical protein